MKKDYRQLGIEIVACLGGPDNIEEVYHCATRLRTQIKNDDMVDKDSLSKISAVLGVVEVVGGLQIIIGNEVSHVCKAITDEYNIKSGVNVDENLDAPARKKNVVSSIMNTMAAVMVPAVPLIMVSGLISALLVIATKLGLSTESTTYTILSMVGGAAMYFMPVILAYTAAERFECNKMISVFLGAIMISPTIVGLVETGEFVRLFGLPMKTMNYTSSVVPIILTIWVFSYVEKLVDKIVPPALKFVIHPLVCVVIMLPLMLCVTGPIGGYIGNGLSMLLLKIYEAAPWMPVLIVGCLAPLLVITGMHMALTPVLMFEFATLGFDSCMFVSFIGMNFSQFGVALACMLKTKNKNLRTLASSCALTAFLSGVTEPTLYGICVRMKTPLIATWIACIVNAVFCSIMSVKAYVFGAPSFFTMLMFMSPDGSMRNLWMAIIATAISIVVSFAATWILGFDDSVYGEE